VASLLRKIVAGAICAALVAGPAVAGPPYFTDDPQPTEEGHWEIYSFVYGSHDRGGLDGEAGLDLNYGGAKDLQLTAVLPLAYENENGFSTKGLGVGTGVVELAAKYKIVHADDTNWIPDVSVFPRVFAPTDHRYGTGHVGLLLPVWAEKDFGPWQVFGGGGYQINPGVDQRNFWQGGIAANRSLGKRLQLGMEVFGQTRDAVDGPGFVAVNFAATVKLMEHWSLLASAGPLREQGGGTGQLFYLSLKADY
jgi:hypothetical protein